MFRSAVPLVALCLRARQVAARILAQPPPPVRRIFFALPLAFGASAFSDSAAQRQLPTAADMSKIMLPDHANPAGNVHGGTILQMIDQAGYVAATKYCNQGRKPSSSSPPLVAALARLERCDFHQAMHIGEVAQVHAEVTFVAKHSVEVLVEVEALNPLTGQVRHTNTARVWYVAMPLPEMGGRLEPATLLPMQYPSAEAEEAGRQRYNRQKTQRQNTSEMEQVVADCMRVRRDMMQLHLNPAERKRHTVGDSASSLVQLLLPSDCTSNGLAQAGTIMKLMDNVAGIVAARHCRKNVVTVSVDSMDFHTPVRNSNVVSLYAWPTFTSSRSIEIEVAVFAEGLDSPQTLCNSSRFTFVSLDSKERVAELPALEKSSSGEWAAWERGEGRYKARKQERQQQKQ